MKISKSTLKAVLVGITLSAAASSCSLVETLSDKDKHQCVESCEAQCTLVEQNQTLDNCPACGLG